MHYRWTRNIIYNSAQTGYASSEIEKDKKLNFNDILKLMLNYK